MSDAVAISIVTGVVSIITLIIQLKMNKKVDTVDRKLDDNHKQQNGNLDKLLKTTEQLAIANEKAKHKRT